MNYWPQITWIVLVAMDLGVSLAKNGQPKDSRYSFAGQVIAAAIMAGILYAGGFFA